MHVENNLRQWRNAAEMTREVLAERVGISAVSIYRIENAAQNPRPELLQQICSVFGKAPRDFYAHTDGPEVAALGTRRVPILDFVSAGDFLVIAQAADKDLEEFVLTDLKPSDGSFALRIRGRSMEPVFSEGDVIIVDPAVYPRAEDFVVAVDERGEGNFKQYHDLGLNEHGQKVFELVSLNPAYPTWRSDRMQITIKGTMVEHRRFRRR